MTSSDGGALARYHSGFSLSIKAAAHKKTPCPTGQGRVAWYHLAFILCQPDGIKKPLSTMGQGRNRGTTLHYTLMANP